MFSYAGRMDRQDRLASELVIKESPMSFTGSAKRIRRAVFSRVPEQPWGLLVAAVALILLVYLAWLAVLGWYLMFGLFLIPSRLSRRKQVHAEVEALRHRELIEAIRESGQAPENPS